MISKGHCIIVALAILAFGARAEPRVVVALGDSISRGFDARWPKENDSLNWATGTAIQSYWLKVSDDGGRAENLAVSGSTSSSMLWQIPFIADDATDVTVMIGSNDACGGFGEYTKENVTTALHLIRDRLPAARIVLVAIPRISSVFETRHQYPYCRFVWALSNTCPAFLGALVSDDDRNAAQQRLDALNEDLRLAALDYGAEFIAAIGELELGPGDVSAIDCFHPSVQGQQRLSDIVLR